ncbi:MAG: hypothetical protein KA138_11165 [Saprospiraceae bacterium]|jgi:hypothetical protein|nr:hypothetical protein [Saprospiraceae bacterium]
MNNSTHIHALNSSSKLNAGQQGFHRSYLLSSIAGKTVAAQHYSFKNPTKSTQLTRFVVREPRNVKELESLLRLRYQEFQPHGMIAENPYALDLDYFDQNAYHVGLFREENGVSSAIGSMRMVVSTPTRFQPMVQEIAARASYFMQKLTETPLKPLPLFNYAPFSEALDRFWNTAQCKGFGVFEASRFCIRKDSSTMGLATFLMEGANAISAQLLPNYIWCNAVTTRHEACHRRNGYHRIPGTDCFDHPHGQACILHASMETLPVEKRLRIEKMQSQFEAHGSICMQDKTIQNFKNNYQA